MQRIVFLLHAQIASAPYAGGMPWANLFGNRMKSLPESIMLSTRYQHGCNMKSS